MENFPIDVLEYNNTLTVLYATGAYGREYLTLADVLSDWLDGKDFRVISGPYFSSRDADVLIRDGFGHVDVDGWLIPLK